GARSEEPARVSVAHVRLAGQACHVRWKAIHTAGRGPGRGVDPRPEGDSRRRLARRRGWLTMGLRVATSARLVTMGPRAAPSPRAPYPRLKAQALHAP